jgi:hypothetical protein
MNLIKKKQYKKPIFLKYGEVKKLTLSSGSTDLDGMTGMSMEFEF